MNDEPLNMEHGAPVRVVAGASKKSCQWCGRRWWSDFWCLICLMTCQIADCSYMFISDWYLPFLLKRSAFFLDPCRGSRCGRCEKCEMAWPDHGFQTLAGAREVHQHWSWFDLFPDLDYLDGKKMAQKMPSIKSMSPPRPPRVGFVLEIYSK